MRACIFVSDLGAVASRKAALLRELAAVTGEHTAEVCFVGLRQTQPVRDDTPGYVPYVPAENYLSARIGNTVLRLADAGLAPRQAVESAVSRVATSVVEAILACDPDVVLLDVRWGQHLLPLLEPEFPGCVYVTGDRGILSPRRRDVNAEGQKTKVSIVLPTYNGSKYLRQSIQSCLDQSHRNVELIVVDDGSRENIGAVVGEFHDTRIRYVRHETNRGLPASLNTGFRLATGTFLTWTSDDNYYVPDTIERLTSFLQRHPGIAFVYSSMFIIDETTGAVPRARLALPAADLKKQNSIGGCFLYHRRVYEAVGEYEPRATLVEDYDYWVRVSKQFRMQRLIEPLYYYRYHESSLTSKHGPEDVAKQFDVVRRQNGLAVTR